MYHEGPPEGIYLENICTKMSYFTVFDNTLTLIRFKLLKFLEILNLHRDILDQNFSTHTTITNKNIFKINKKSSLLMFFFNIFNN